MKVILWSEFPSSVNWREAKKLFRDSNLKAEIYVASRSKKEFFSWKNKIESSEIEVGAWPVLSKKEGYWFSGLCEKSSIDKLKQFSGLKIKIDLEPPFPSWDYNDFKFLLFSLSLILKEGKNNNYLKETIDDLSKSSTVLVNEFPLSRQVLSRSGIFYDLSKKKNIIKNIMLYSTIPNPIFRPLVKAYLRNFAKNFIARNGSKGLSFSIGLIGSGILKNENTYRDIKEFAHDLDFIKKIGCQKVAIYSIDSIMQKKNPEEWIRFIKKYQK